MHAWVTQLRKGLVDLCVLAVLRSKEAYGYQIVEELRHYANLELTESTVYPVLTRLTREKLLSVRTEASPSGPPRRYYRFTPEGQARYAQMIQRWNALQESVDKLIQEKFNDRDDR